MIKEILTKPERSIRAAYRPGQLLLACFLFTCLPLKAQESGIRRFSLEEARSHAVEFSYETLKSKLDLEAARQRMKETLASGLPQITSKIGYNNNLKLATSLIPNFFEGKPEEKIPIQFGTQHNANASITIDQLIFNGSYFVGLQTTRIYENLAKKGVERTKLDVQEMVTTTYYLILVAKESERILQSNLANLEKTLFEIQERYKEGFVAETDVDLIQISVTQLKNGLQTVQKQKVIAHKLLNFQMGLDLNVPIELTEDLESILAQTDIAKEISAEFDLETNIDYKLLVSQEKLASLALKNEKAKYWPTISAFYTYQQNAFRDSFNFFSSSERWFPFQIFGININIPIFKSGAQKAKVSQAAVALEQAQTNRLQGAQGLVLQAEQAKTELSTAHENHINLLANMNLAKKVYEVTLVKYKEGVASSMELTQANDKFLAAESDYIQALSDLLNAKNKLDRIASNY